MKFYKRDPDAALAGMADLTLQECGAYNRIIDNLYSRDGLLPDDDAMLRRLMGCHGNEWRAVKTALLAKGKIWIEDGYLKANRVDSVLKEAGNFSETQRKRAGKRWENEGKRTGKSGKDQQNQNTTDARAALPLTPIATPIAKAVVLPPDGKWTSLVSDALGFDISARQPADVIQFLRSGQGLMELGIDIALDLVPLIRERRASGKIPQNLKSLFWFKDAALEGRAARLLAEQIREVRATTPVEDTDHQGWKIRLDRWLDGGYWPPKYGPRPRVPGCMAPATVLVSALAVWDAQGGHPAGAFPADPNGRFRPWKDLRDLRDDPDVDYGNRALNVIAIPRRA